MAFKAVELQYHLSEDQSWSGEKVVAIDERGTRTQIAKRWRVGPQVRFVGEGAGALLETSWEPQLPAPYAGAPVRLVRV